MRKDSNREMACGAWVYEEVLPTIRKTGSYSLDFQQARLEERLQRLEQEVSSRNAGHFAEVLRLLKEAIPAQR